MKAISLVFEFGRWGGVGLNRHRLALGFVRLWWFGESLMDREERIANALGKGLRP